MLVWAGLTTTALAQDVSQPGGNRHARHRPVPAPPAGNPGDDGRVRTRLPTPPAGPAGRISRLVESAGTPTANLEVKVGQGRFLTLKEDLVVPGNPPRFWRWATRR